MAAAELKQVLRSSTPLPEKHWKLNQFLKDLTALEIEDVLAVFDENDVCSQWIRLKLAKKFQRTDTVINILKNGDRKIISQAVTLPWMYGHEKSPFENVDYLVNQLFPVVSFSCRQKIVNCIGKYMKMEDKVDNIFDAVHGKYGFYAAIPLLPACTKNKLNSMMSTRTVKFTNRQLLQISKKYPDVAYTILQQYHNDHQNRMSVYPIVIKELMDQNPLKFSEFLIANYEPLYFRVGKYRSRKILQVAKNLVLEHPEKFIELLNINQVRKRMTMEEYQVIVKTSMPKELLEWQSDVSMWVWLKKYPKARRLDLLKAAFFKHFKVQLLDCPEYFSPDVVALLPDDERMKIVDCKIRGDCPFTNYGLFYASYRSTKDNLFAWTAFKPIEKAVPELKQMLLTEQEVPSRAQIAKCLIMSCLVNDNSQELLNVLQLLTQRSRNDQVEVRNEIFAALAIIGEHMKFDQDHWECIMEMIHFSHLYKEHSYAEEAKINLLEKCIVFKLERNLSVETITSFLVKLKLESFCDDDDDWKWSISGLKKPAEQALMFNLFIRALQTTFPSGTPLYGDKYSIQGGVAGLIKMISKWNEQHKATHPPIPILASPWLAERVQEIIQLEDISICGSRSKYLQSRLQQIKTTYLQAVLKDNLLNDDTLKSFALTFPCDLILSVLLKKKPSLLEENWNLIMEHILSLEYHQIPWSFIKKIKSSGYDTLVDNTIKLCINMIEQEDTEAQEKCNAIRILSIVQNSSDFINEVASKFYPTEARIDISVENSEMDYDIKTAVAKSLKDISSSASTFVAIEKFCIGDYFKLISGSMYSQVCLTSEKEALIFLKSQLSKEKSVSIKKHLIRLLAISCIEEKKKMVSLLWTLEQEHVSIRHEIFVQLVQLFLDDSSEDTWTALSLVINSLNAEDKASLCYLQNPRIFDFCPPEYVSPYIQASLNILKKEKGDASETLSGFISEVKCAMTKVENKLLDTIVQEYVCFYDNEEDFTCRSTEESFYNKYILQSSTLEILNHRLEIIKLTYEAFINDEVHQQTYDAIYRTRKASYAFIRFLCEDGLKSALAKKDEESDDSMFQIFKTRKVFQELLLQLNTLPASKTFKLTLYLQLALRLLDEKEKKNEEVGLLRRFGIAIAELFDSTVRLYGYEVVSLITKTMRDFSHSCLSEELECQDDVVDLILGLLDTSISRTSQIVAVGLLPRAPPKLLKLKETYVKIETKINQADDLVVKIFQGV